MGAYENIKNSLDTVYGKIKPDNLNEWLDDVGKIADIFVKGEGLQDFARKLELVWHECKGSKEEIVSEEKKKKLYAILMQIKEREPDYLVNQLKNIKLPSNVKKELEKQAFRILEQTRLGKRDVATYMILRIFVAQNKKFPRPLIDILKPSWPDDILKAFIYAFIGSVISGKEEGNE